MIISVVIPTYRRPQELKRCLKALKIQDRLPDEVLIILRDTDKDTQSFLSEYNTGELSVKILSVSTPGVVAAMNIGLKHFQGDIVAFTDDDAIPHPDWLLRIENHFLNDSKVGGVGGRDWVYHGSSLEDGWQNVVGRVQWFGRTIGNHHIGVGTVQEVDILKGVNMSFRREAIAHLCFDTRMRGTGAQVNFEIAFSLSVKQRGWTLLYDPAVAVDHYPAKRFDEDQRTQFSSLAWSNRVYNETLALLSHFSQVKRIIYFCWVTLLGHRENWGIAQLIKYFFADPKLAIHKWWLSQQARLEAIQTLM